MVIGLKELEQLHRDLLSFLQAGVPMPHAFRQLATQFPSRRLRQLSEEIAPLLEAGTPLSAALRKATVRVPEEFVTIIECSEVAGDLVSGIRYSMEHCQRIQRHRSALLTTAFYPALLLIASLCVIWVLCNTVVLRTKAMMDQLGYEYPLPMMIMHKLADLISGLGGLMIVLAISALLLACFLTPLLRSRLYITMSRFGGMNTVAGLSDLSLLMHLLALQLGKGVPLPQALRAARFSALHPKTRAALVEMAHAAECGRPISPLLPRNFPATASYLIFRGEETGNLAAVCADVATYCEERFEILSRRYLATLEPLLILLSGVYVFAVVLVFYLPLFQIPRLVR